MGMGISPMELAVIAIIALVVLGPNKLPEAARSLGKGMREMRDSFQDAAQSHDDDDQLVHASDDEDLFHEHDDEDDPEFEPQPVRADPVDASGESASDEAPSDEAASAPDEAVSAPDEEDHQNDARSSVPSSSSSSTERE